jgi:hypothetical protein
VSDPVNANLSLVLGSNIICIRRNRSRSLDRLARIVWFAVLCVCSRESVPEHVLWRLDDLCVVLWWDVYRVVG